MIIKQPSAAFPHEQSIAQKGSRERSLFDGNIDPSKCNEKGCDVAELTNQRHVVYTSSAAEYGTKNSVGTPPVLREPMRMPNESCVRPRRPFRYINVRFHFFSPRKSDLRIAMKDERGTLCDRQR